MSDWRIIAGDALEILGSVGPVDSVITDPVWPNCPAGLLSGSEDPEGLLRQTLALVDCRRLVVVLRDDSDPRFLRAVPERWPFFQRASLPYAVPGYNGRKLGGDETAYCFGEPIPSSPGRRLIPRHGPVAQPERTQPVDHPSPRALSHMRWLVNWWSSPGEMILDPFAGSGTIGMAAVELGRRFIGIEIDRGYVAMAERRIDEATRQARLELG